jgi:hypothetical protein
VDVSGTGDSEWRVGTENGGLSWIDPGGRRSALRAALEDCAETLSPAGRTPALSTYWVDLLLSKLREGRGGDVAHGNLWVLSLNGGLVEIRMDVDAPDSEALEVVEADDLIHGLDALRAEVLDRLANGHRLDDRPWMQKNPLPR